MAKHNATAAAAVSIDRARYATPGGRQPARRTTSAPHRWSESGGGDERPASERVGLPTATERVPLPGLSAGVRRGGAAAAGE